MPKECKYLKILRREISINNKYHNSTLWAIMCKKDILLPLAPIGMEKGEVRTLCNVKRDTKVDKTCNAPAPKKMNNMI